MARVMGRMMAGISLTALIVLGTLWVMAQDAAADCQTALVALYTAASDACINKPTGTICNGGSAPAAEPAGPVANALAPVGALLETGVVDAIQTPPLVPGSSAGLIWIRTSAPMQYSGLMVGSVGVRDNTPPDFPAWQSLIVRTQSDASSCPQVPRSAFVIQSPAGQPVNVAINGVSLGLNGTVLVQTVNDSTIFAGLSGQTSVFAAGVDQFLRPGQEILVPHAGESFSVPSGPPGAPLPLDEAVVRNFPVALLDRTIILPEPGYVTTDGPVNMRVSPSRDAAVLVQVPAGQVLSVLGRNPAGDWYHVRLDSGETGWMFGSLLLQNVGEIEAVYESTPLPPQRYGEIGQVGKVQAPAGANMRSAPDAAFPLIMTVPDGAIVRLLARSPYSPWVKVDFNGVVGWLALITLETKAVIDAYPVDFNVPPPPTPTRVPGSFGNAFPDPSKPGG